MFINRSEKIGNQVSVEKLKKRKSTNTETFSETLESVYGTDAVNVDYSATDERSSQEQNPENQAKSDTKPEDTTTDTKLDITA
jgi:hypothetical protein